MVTMPRMLKRRFLIILILPLVVFAAGVPTAQIVRGQSAAQESPERDARMRWFREAKFGLFIHWGLCRSCGGMERTSDPGHR